MNLIRIGALGDTFSLKRAHDLQTLLTAQEIASEICLIPNEDALLMGEVDILTADMAELPPFLPEGWKIAAVSERLDPSESLVIKDGQTMEPGRLFGLTEGALVGCASPLQAGQLRVFRPDLQTIVKTPVEGIEGFFSGNLAAYVVPTYTLDSLSFTPDSYKAIRLHPLEMIPAPAQGVTAWIAHTDDLPTRRLLKRVHHPEVSAVTNVERMALRLLAPGSYNAFGAYCSRDKIGNLHVYGILFPTDGNGPKQAKLSSSTSFRLAERLVAVLA